MTDLQPFRKKFSNRQQALAVRVNKTTNPAQISAALQLPPCTRLLLISGGAGLMTPAIFDRLFDLVTTVCRAIAQEGTIVIDGGTQAGVMQLMGEGLARNGRPTTQIGVLPAHAEIEPGLEAEGRLEPHHSRFVLVEGDAWGDEVATMYKLAAFLAQDAPSVTLLINGGGIALKEVEWNVRQGREVIVVTGSGRLADEIAAAVRQPDRPARPPVAAVISQGQFTLFDLEKPPEQLVALLQNRLDLSL